MVEHIDESTWDSLRFRLRKAVPYLIPRPSSGIRWLDVTYVLMIGMLQFTILPSLGVNWFRIEFMTPWVVAAAVVQPYSMSLIIGVAAALVTEGRTSVPAGTVICAYTVIINVIFLVRDLISWRRPEPWLSAMGLAILWSVSFEFFVEAMENPEFSISLTYLLQTAGRIAASFAFGILLQQWALRYLEQELSDL